MDINTKKTSMYVESCNNYRKQYGFYSMMMQYDDDCIHNSSVVLFSQVSSCELYYISFAIQSISLILCLSSPHFLSPLHIIIHNYQNDDILFQKQFASLASNCYGLINHQITLVSLLQNSMTCQLLIIKIGMMISTK